MIKKPPTPMWCPLCRGRLVLMFRRVDTLRNAGRTVSFDRREHVCPTCKIAVIVHHVSDELMKKDT